MRYKDARAVVADQGNWWSEDGGRPISLVATDQGLAVYHGDDVAIDLLRVSPTELPGFAC